MCGGLLQLVSKGAEDIYLIGNPQITMFKCAYRRHTNFSKFEHKLNFNNKPDFGRTSRCSIKKYGDLLSKLYLVIELPQITVKYYQLTHKKLAEILLTAGIVYSYDLPSEQQICRTYYEEYIVPLIKSKIEEYTCNINKYSKILELFNKQKKIDITKYLCKEQIKKNDHIDNELIDNYELFSKILCSPYYDEILSIIKNNDNINFVQNKMTKIQTNDNINANMNTNMNTNMNIDNNTNINKNNNLFYKILDVISEKNIQYNFKLNINDTYNLISEDYTDRHFINIKNNDATNFEMYAKRIFNNFYDELKDIFTGTEQYIQFYISKFAKNIYKTLDKYTYKYYNETLFPLELVPICIIDYFIAIHDKHNDINLMINKKKYVDIIRKYDDNFMDVEGNRKVNDKNFGITCNFIINKYWNYNFIVGQYDEPVMKIIKNIYGKIPEIFFIGDILIIEYINEIIERYKLIDDYDENRFLLLLTEIINPLINNVNINNIDINDIDEYNCSLYIIFIWRNICIMQTNAYKKLVSFIMSHEMHTKYELIETYNQYMRKNIDEKTNDTKLNKKKYIYNLENLYEKLKNICIGCDQHCKIIEKTKCIKYETLYDNVMGVLNEIINKFIPEYDPKTGISEYKIYLYKKINEYKSYLDIILNKDNRINIFKRIETLIWNNCGNKPAKFAWAKYIGHALIDEIILKIGGQTIDKHNGEWLYLDYVMSASESHKKGYNEMLGNINELTMYNELPKPKHTLFIPLQFWFCKNINEALPLIALLYNEIEIILRLKNIEDVSYRSNDTFFEKKPQIKCHIIADYVLLEKSERHMFIDHPHEYIINTVQYEDHNINCKKTNICIDLYTTNICRYILWTNKIINNKRMSCDEIELVDMQKILNWCDYDKLTNTQISILFNNRERETSRDSLFYNSVIPYARKLSSLNDGMFFYSFALFPLLQQSSGGVNADMLRKISLNIDLPDEYKGLELQINTYSKCLSVMRIINGLAGMVFYPMVNV